MALSIKNERAERLLRELAARTGETLTGAMIRALEEQLERNRKETGAAKLEAELARIRERCAALPVLDDRNADEILGYDDAGAPR